MGNFSPVDGVKSYKISRSADMDAYDQLPQVIKDYLKSAPTRLTAFQAKAAIETFGVELGTKIYIQGIVNLWVKLNSTPLRL